MYLIFKNEELVDVLDFTDEQLELFKKENPDCEVIDDLDFDSPTDLDDDEEDEWS